MSVVAGASVLDTIQLLHDVAGHNRQTLHASLDSRTTSTELGGGGLPVAMWLFVVDPY